MAKEITKFCIRFGMLCTYIEIRVYCDKIMCQKPSFDKISFLITRTLILPLGWQFIYFMAIAQENRKKKTT